MEPPGKSRSLHRVVCWGHQQTFEEAAALRRGAQEARNAAEVGDQLFGQVIVLGRGKILALLAGEVDQAAETKPCQLCVRRWPAG